MTILFLHGLESGPKGRKARYLQEKYPSTSCVPDLQMSLWHLDKANSVVRMMLKLVWNHPLWAIKNTNILLKNALLNSLSRCADIAKQAILSLREKPVEIVIGSSWGGAVALFLLAHGDWKGPVLLIAPALKKVLSMQGIQEGNPLYRIESWCEAIRSNVDKKGHILVIHGDKDENIPLEDSKELCQSIHADLIVIPGGDHSLNNYLLDQNQFHKLIDNLLLSRSLK